MLKVLKPTTEQRIVSGFIESTRGLFAGEKWFSEDAMLFFFNLTEGHSAGEWDARRVAEHLYGVRFVTNYQRSAL